MKNNKIESREFTMPILKSGNSYIAIRHGEAESNILHILNSDPSVQIKLTPIGRDQVKQAISQIPSNLDLIIYSPLQRARESAEIIKNSLNIEDRAFLSDEQVRELGMGAFEGLHMGEKHSVFKIREDEFTISVGGSETLNQLRVRMGTFLHGLEQKYKNKKILIVSHGDPLWILEAVIKNLDISETLALDKTYIKNAEVRILNSK